jgi:esterase/lipase superfamily enzyme
MPSAPSEHPPPGNGDGDYVGSCHAMTVMTRRRVLAGGAGMVATAAFAAGGYILVETGIAPGKYRLAEILGACGTDPGVPKAIPGPVLATRFMSRYRGRTVQMLIMRPPGHYGALPVAVVMHGVGDDAASALRLGYPEFLAASVTSGGAAPFSLVSVDGGSSTYWHPRAGHDDPLGMIIHEVLPRLSAEGYQVGRVGLTGWSMGGYGALLLAARLGAARVAAVAASSPAIFASYDEAHAANSLAFDNAADFAVNNVSDHLDTLKRLPVMIDCGSSDPFAAQDALLRRRLGHPPGGISAGCHDQAFWRRHMPEQLAFLGAHLTPSVDG